MILKNAHTVNAMDNLFICNQCHIRWSSPMSTNCIKCGGVAILVKQTLAPGGIFFRDPEWPDLNVNYVYAEAGFKIIDSRSVDCVRIEEVK